jgi:PAS domain S-box-containing protein
MMRDITDRKQAELALQESEAQLQRLAANLPGVVYRYVRYADGRDAFVYLSARCDEIFGITAEAAIADSNCIWAVVHPDDVASLAEAVADSEADPTQRFYVEHRIITPAGQLKWLRTTASAPCYGDEGEVIWDGFVNDITERQQAELEIRRNQDLREAIFNESTDALFLVDRETLLIADCNNRAIDLFEAEAKADLLDIQGNSLQRQQFTREELAEIKQEFNQKGFWSREIEYLTFKGLSFWGNLAAKPITVAGTHLTLVRITDITERKRIETQIRQREQQLQLTLAFTGIGAWSWHPTTGKYAWTGRMEEMLEIPPGLDNMYEVWRARLHPDDVDRVESTIETAIASGFPFSEEYRYRRLDGRFSWMWVQGQSMCTETGQLEQVLGIVQDITERKQVETALQKSQEQLSLAVEFGRVAIWNWDVASGQLALNSVAFEILGYPPDSFEPTYDHWLQAVHPDDRNAADQAVEQAIAAQQAFAIEYRVLWPDGSQHWIMDCGRAIYDANGQPVRAAGIMLDITDRKIAEQALQESETRFRQLAEAVQEGFFVLDVVSNCYAYINPALLTIMGMAEADFEVMTHWLDRVHPEDRDRIAAAVEQQLGGEVFDQDYRFIRPDGELRWLRSRSFSVYDQAGALIRLVGTVDDITERKLAELALQQLNSELEARVRQRTQEIQKLAALVENSTDLIGMANLDGETIYLNRTGHQLLGVTPDDLLGRPVDTFLCPDERLRLQQEVWPLVLQQGFWQGESTFRHLQTGEDITLEQAIFLIQDPESDGTLCMGTVCRDIRDRKQAELALQQSEERFRQIAETIQDVFWMTTPDSADMLYVSPAFEQVWGLSCKQLYQSPQAWLEAVHPEDQPSVKDLLVAASASGGYSKIYRIFRPNGEMRWIHDRAFPVLNEAGEVYRLVGVAKDITDRKQAGLALQESETRFRQLFSATPTPIQGYDKDRRVIFWNQASTALYGYTEAEALGQRVEDLIIPEPMQAAIVPVVDAWITGTGAPVPNGELSLRHKTGKLVPVYSTHVKFNSLQGEPEMYCIDVDLREIKQAEMALRDSEERFRQIAETIQDVFWMTTPDASEVLYMSSAFEAVWGQPVDAIYQDALLWFEAIHPDDQPRLAKATGPQLAQGYDEIYRVIRPDGELRWVHDRAFPVHNEAGEIYRVVGLAKDITQAWQDELRLQESEKRFRAAFEQAAVGMVQADLTGRLVRVNQAFCNLLGYSATELCAKTYADITHPADLAQDQANVICLLAGEVPSFVMEKRYLRSDGAVVWSNLTVSLIRDSVGEPQYFIGVISDITDRKQAAAALQQLNLELEQRVETRTQELQTAMETAEAANRAKSTFLANMSHELRTPLNAILGFTQLMARDLALSIENREYLGIINRSGEHLLNLINDILEMSKIEAGQVQMNVSSFDLIALLDALQDMFLLRAKHKGLDLLIECDAALPRYLKTDEHKLRQVLINLVGNAIKFTANGQVALRVGLASALLAEPNAATTVALTFKVDDTGLGIDPSDIDSLFQPFTQVNQTDNPQEGTGLGLPISRQFIHLLGGELTVDSQPGVGSTFSFTIPVEVVDWAAAPASDSVTQWVIGLVPGQPSYRILVADDNDTHRQLLVRLLQSIGLEVREANHGQMAIALWQSWRPHLIWMDTRMPELDGYTATQRIRELEAGQRVTKIIALTANAFEENRVQALDSGCDDFVRKPFQISQLFNKMADHLGLAYQYGQACPTSPANPASTAPLAVLANLQDLPIAIVEQLYQATLQLDNQQLAILITQLAPEHPALAELLGQKLEEFAIDQIHTWLQHVISSAT